MARYEYKVIPSPRKPLRGKGLKTVADRFANTLTQEMNAQAASGWEFVRSETLPMDEKPGMFKKPVETYQSVIVFRRELEDQSDAVPLPATAILASREMVAKPDSEKEPVVADRNDETPAIPVEAAIAAVPANADELRNVQTKTSERPGYWD